MSTVVSKKMLKSNNFTYISFSRYFEESLLLIVDLLIYKLRFNLLKWAGSFFKTITNVLDGMSGITKNIIFFHLEVCERRNFDFCVFLRMISGSGWRPVYISWMEGTDVLTPSSSLPAYRAPLHIRKNTQKSKFLLSQTLKCKKKICFL